MTPPLKKDQKKDQKKDLKKDQKKDPKSGIKAEGNKSIYKKKDSRHHGAEDTLKKSAAEEAERQRQAEEARLSVLKDDEHQLKSNTSFGVIKNEADRKKDLIAWVKSVPLSQDCIDRIDRSFSDGSLLAEVIHHFCPNICDNRQFFSWSSKVNKISNWKALNNKVFPKLGFRLNQRQIDNLLNPYSCGKFQRDCEKGLFIYKLLHRIRKELAERNSAVLEYRKSNFVPPPVCDKKPPKRKLVNFLENPPFSRVEMLLERGHYDKDKETDKDKKKDTEQSESPPPPKCTCPSKSEGCFQTFIPCNFPYNCLTFDENGKSCHEICITPNLSFKCAQPSASCYFC